MSLRTDKGNLKVVRHDPVRDRRLKIILVLTVLVLGFLAYWFGGSEANQLSGRLQLQNMTLEEKAEVLIKDNELLRQRVAILESAGKIDREAANNVRVMVRQLEDDKEQLNKKLIFYKSVIAPEDLNPGIRVAGLDLDVSDNPRTYKIRLVISQVARLNPFVKGFLNVSISGEQNGKKETLSLQKLAGMEESKTALGFRYFQALPDNRGSLEFQIPEGFEPETIDVAVRITKGSVKNFKQSFYWDKELAADVQQN